jgi:adenylate cyclase
VMLAGEQVGDVVLTRIALLTACRDEPQFPLARGGVHAGTAIRSGDDFLGAGVNVTARITALAGGGQLLLTKQAAAAARSHGYPVHELGEVPLRNVSKAVELFSVDLGPAEHILDPVCRMTVDKQTAAGRLRFEEHDYWFCSLECAGTFAADPTSHGSAPRG